MLIIYIPLLAAFGAAIVFRGHAVRGLIVLLVANATVFAGAAASTRWGWAAFSLSMTGLCVLGIAMVRNADPEPAPAPAGDEKSPDYCWTHKTLEPKEER